MSGIREIICVTQKELHEIVNERSAVRVGATIDPEDRARGYTYEGYAGIMYIASTVSMMKAEDKLLEVCRCVHNVHRRSNAPDAPGFVYVIIGRKMR